MFFFFFSGGGEAFLTSENDVICTVTLRHLSELRRVMVRCNVRKELFPRLKGIFSLGKTPFLFPSKITENSIRNEFTRIINAYWGVTIVRAGAVKCKDCFYNFRLQKCHI